MSSSAESSSNYSKLHQGKINGVIMKGGATNYDNYLVDTKQQKQKQSQKSEDKLSETRNRKEKKKIHRSLEDLVCSMCGDIGISQFLSLCITCSRRYQHTYCSRDYPGMSTDKEALVCNWCLHEEDAVKGRRKKKGSAAGGHVHATMSPPMVPAEADDGGSSDVVSGGGQDSDSGNDIDLCGSAGVSEAAGLDDRCAATADDLSADGGSDTGTDAAEVIDCDGAVDDTSGEYSKTGPAQLNGGGDNHGMRIRFLSVDRRRIMISSSSYPQSDHGSVVPKQQRCREDDKGPISISAAVPKQGGTDYYHDADEDRLGVASSSQFQQMLMSSNQKQQHTKAFDYLLKIAAESFPHDGTLGSSAVAVSSHRHMERNSSVIKKRKIDAAAAVDRHPVPASVIIDDNNRAGSINISRKRSAIQRSNYSAPVVQQIDAVQIISTDDATVKDEKHHGGSMISRRKSSAIPSRAAINLVKTLRAAATKQIIRDEANGTGSRSCRENSSATTNEAVVIDAAAKLGNSSDGLLTPKSPPSTGRHPRICSSATTPIKAPRPQNNVAPGSDLQRHDTKPNDGAVVNGRMRFSLGSPSSGINSSNHNTAAPTISKIQKKKKKKNNAAINPGNIDPKHRGGLVKSIRFPSSTSIVVVGASCNNIGGHDDAHGAVVPASASKNSNSNKTNNHHRNNSNNQKDDDKHRNNNNSSSKFVTKDDSSNRSARSSVKSSASVLSRTSDKINGAIDVESGGSAVARSTPPPPTINSSSSSSSPTRTTTPFTAVIADQKAATITGVKNSKTDRQQKASPPPSSPPPLALVSSTSTGATARYATAIADDDSNAKKEMKDGDEEDNAVTKDDGKQAQASCPESKPMEPYGSSKDSVCTQMGGGQESNDEGLMETGGGVTVGKMGGGSEQQQQQQQGRLLWIEPPPTTGNNNNNGHAFGHVPKRQRCGLTLIRPSTATTTHPLHHHHCNFNNGDNNNNNNCSNNPTITTIHDIDVLHKCRKKTSPLFSPASSSSSPRPNYRRYKLLADVLC